MTPPDPLREALIKIAPQMVNWAPGHSVQWADQLLMRLGWHGIALAATPPAVPELDASWIEVPDYRGLLERLAGMLDRGFASEREAWQEYDALATEVCSILKANPDSLSTGSASDD